MGQRPMTILCACQQSTQSGVHDFTHSLPSLQSFLASFVNHSQYSSFYLKRLGEGVFCSLHSRLLLSSFLCSQETDTRMVWVNSLCLLVWLVLDQWDSQPEEWRWKSMKRQCLVFFPGSPGEGQPRGPSCASGVHIWYQSPFLESSMWVLISAFSFSPLGSDGPNDVLYLRHAGRILCLPYAGDGTW